MDLVTSDWLDQAPTCLCRDFINPRRKLRKVLKMDGIHREYLRANKYLGNVPQIVADVDWRLGRETRPQDVPEALLPSHYVSDCAVKFVRCLVCYSTTQVKAKREGEYLRDAYVEVEMMVDAERSLGLRPTR